MQNNFGNMQSNQNGFHPEVFPFLCECGARLNNDREIQQHANSCTLMFNTYGMLVQSFVQLKHQAGSAQQPTKSTQLRMNLLTLLRSFSADIEQHLNANRQKRPSGS